MKIISASVHSYLDYLTVVLLWLSPTLFGLPPVSSLLAYALSSAHLLLTLTTDYRWSMIDLIPFPVHGWLELLVAAGLLGVAYYLGLHEGPLARNFYVGAALAIYLLWLLTDYQSRDQSADESKPAEG